MSVYMKCNSVTDVTVITRRHVTGIFYVNNNSAKCGNLDILCSSYSQTVHFGRFVIPNTTIASIRNFTTLHTAVAVNLYTSNTAAFAIVDIMTSQSFHVLFIVLALSADFIIVF